jgi:hypothetical protein
MRVSQLHRRFRKASLSDELEDFFVTVPAVAWSGKKAFLNWIDSSQGTRAIAQNLGWPKEALASYINSLKGTDWSNLVRTYR